MVALAKLLVLSRVKTNLVDVRVQLGNGEAKPLVIAFMVKQNPRVLKKSKSKAKTAGKTSLCSGV